MDSFLWQNVCTEFKNLHESFALNMSTKPWGSLCYIHLLHSSALRGHFVNLGMCVKQNFPLEDYLMIKDCVKHEPTLARESQDIKKKRGRAKERELSIFAENMSPCAFFPISQGRQIKKEKHIQPALGYLNSMNSTMCTLTDWWTIINTHKIWAVMWLQTPEVEIL